MGGMSYLEATQEIPKSACSPHFVTQAYLYAPLFMPILSVKHFRRLMPPLTTNNRFNKLNPRKAARNNFSK